MVAEANDGCADSSFAALELLWALMMSRPVHIITRLRLDAQLYRPAPRRSKWAVPEGGQAIAWTNNPTLGRQR